MRPDQILDRTADKLESGEWQWYQYGPSKDMSPEGIYCASEALWKMTMVDFTLEHDSNWTRWMAVLSAMEKQTQSMSLAFWNDAKGRSKEEVVAAMRAAAQDIRNQV